jgi:hypothetical protein
MDQRSQEQKKADDQFRAENYTSNTIATPPEFLACSVSTSVLLSGHIVLRDIADIVLDNGWKWCNDNRAADKQDNPEWWPLAQRIAETFDWTLLDDPTQPLTVRRWRNSFTFGDQRRNDGPPFGGGCHRAIALAVRVVDAPAFFRPISVLVSYFPHLS